MSASSAPPIRRDWLAKTVAGVLLGFTLAIGCSGVFAWLADGMQMSVRAQLAMWMVMPIWLGIFSGVYFFRSGLRAWAWLGGANALVFGALAAAQWL
ncbi:hypothetical protein GPA19_03430 [Azoarcus indigens]|uniref:Uncharacterized protein n=1 Tax=Azoarcus indigens TaxID=29545 RepID=A0A4R6E721_9RHOO|nr:hypothetical protein [Azoarcus indigens]NMG64001.1 hypothetical protein [Azoarcus indigens]TDN53723.1 hypothetical protein C7389_10477 [Azoarcus indigens]